MITNIDYTNYTKTNDTIRNVGKSTLIERVEGPNFKRWLVGVKMDTSETVYDLVDFDIINNKNQLEKLKEIVEKKGDICLRV